MAFLVTLPLQLVINIAPLVLDLGVRSTLAVARGVYWVAWGRGAEAAAQAHQRQQLTAMVRETVRAEFERAGRHHQLHAEPMMPQSAVAEEQNVVSARPGDPTRQNSTL